MQEAAHEPDHVAIVPDMVAGGMVLVVDDEKLVRNVAEAMLKRLGFAVLEARSGAEAVEVFKLHKDEIRCVLCDLTMPQMDGWETMTELRKVWMARMFMLSLVIIMSTHCSRTLAFSVCTLESGARRVRLPK